MRITVFFGAGSIGKRMLEVWKRYNKMPDFFSDNAKERWSSEYCGIRILSLEELKKIENMHIIITCSQFDDILCQLQKEGISSKCIFKGNTLYDMLCYFSNNVEINSVDVCQSLMDTSTRINNTTKVLFDLTNNFVLGGVESWVIKTGAYLSERGIDISYLIPGLMKECCLVEQDQIVDLHFTENTTFIERLEYGMHIIEKYLPCNIVCNFPLSIFEIACAAKIKWPQEVNLIAVVHNDEEIYYKRYCDMRETIDSCLVISSKIKNTLLERGFPENKIKKLEWEIACENSLEHTYSEKAQVFRMGYAGRVTVGQKRIDLLFEISKKLYYQGVKFILEIAGMGDYLQTLKELIEKEDLHEQIRLLGYVPNEEMNSFWKRQDIVVSCSEYEGRSIAQAEAMASGVVPVITDTSGSRDYVQDGYNGYIVPVGDTEAIVEKICYLYYHRELLKIMGKRSHQKILQQNRKFSLSRIWDEILIS